MLWCKSANSFIKGGVKIPKFSVDTLCTTPPYMRCNYLITNMELFFGGKYIRSDRVTQSPRILCRIKNVLCLLIFYADRGDPATSAAWFDIMWCLHQSQEIRHDSPCLLDVSAQDLCAFPFWFRLWPLSLLRPECLWQRRKKLVSRLSFPVINCFIAAHLQTSSWPLGRGQVFMEWPFLRLRTPPRPKEFSALWRMEMDVALFTWVKLMRGRTFIQHLRALII